MAVAVIAKIGKEIAKEATKEIARQKANVMRKLDCPMNVKELKEVASKETGTKSKMSNLDKPLNSKQEIKQNKELIQSLEKKGGNIEGIRKMEPCIVIEFKCPPGMDKKEFTRQLKAQERGLNSQTLAENIKNRESFEKRKLETGNGRDLESGKKAQEVAREKATQSRIESNQKKGMSYSEAKAEANEWMKSQAALHNPDQIAGGDPSKVSRMGAADVNSSIGSQWRTRVDQLSSNIKEYAKDKSQEELANTKMNVKLVVV